MARFDSVYAREVKPYASKKDKSDKDHEMISRLQFHGGLYLNDKKQIIIPAEVIEATIYAAAKKTKQGKLIQSSVFVEGIGFPLKYDGEQDYKKRFDIEECKKVCLVKIKQNKVLSTRPMFNKWELDAEITYNPSIINKEVLKQIIMTSGQIGLCDWRPKFGRFDVSFL
jgi:hypothetical protein